MCRIDSQKAIQSVHYREHVKSLSSPIHKTAQPSRQSTKLRNMIISMKTKVLIKFGASNVRCVELRDKRLSKVYSSYGEHVKSPSSPIQKTAQPSRQSMKIRIMNNSIETKVLIKFGASDVRFVELRAKKLPKMYTMEYMWKAHPHPYRRPPNQVASQQNSGL